MNESYKVIFLGLAHNTIRALPRWCSGKESACQFRRCQRCEFDPRSRISSEGGHGNSLRYSCLGNPMDRGAWQATVHGVTKSWTQLSNWTHIHVYSIITYNSSSSRNGIFISTSQKEKGWFPPEKAVIRDLEPTLGWTPRWKGSRPAQRVSAACSAANVHTAVVWLRDRGVRRKTQAKMSHNVCVLFRLTYLCQGYCKTVTSLHMRQEHWAYSKNDCTLKVSVGEIPGGASLVLIMRLKLTGSYHISKLNYHIILTMLPWIIKSLLVLINDKLDIYLLGFPSI